MALSSCTALIDSSGRELLQHGTPAFPIGCYHDDLGVAEVAWHWHNELEFFVVTEGSAVVAAGDRRQIVRAGEAFFINALALHGCRDYGNSGCRFHSIAFHPRLVGGSPDSVFYDKYLRPMMENQNLVGLHLAPDIPWQADAVASIESAWQACARKEKGYEFSVRNDLSRLVLLICEHMPDAPKQPSARTQRSAERIKRMLQYVQDHFADELDTASIARSAAISESECLRCFRFVIGTTPIQYLRRYRIQRASHLLQTTGDKISDIAARCGFQDVSYFTKTFREMTGCAPTEYREKHTHI